MIYNIVCIGYVFDSNDYTVVGDYSVYKIIGHRLLDTTTLKIKDVTLKGFKNYSKERDKFNYAYIDRHNNRHSNSIDYCTSECVFNANYICIVVHNKEQLYKVSSTRPDVVINSLSSRSYRDSIYTDMNVFTNLPIKLVYDINNKLKLIKYDIIQLYRIGLHLTSGERNNYLYAYYSISNNKIFASCKRIHRAYNLECYLRLTEDPIKPLRDLGINLDFSFNTYCITVNMLGCSIVCINSNLDTFVLDTSVTKAILLICEGKATKLNIILHNSVENIDIVDETLSEITVYVGRQMNVKGLADLLYNMYASRIMELSENYGVVYSGNEKDVQSVKTAVEKYKIGDYTDIITIFNSGLLISTLSDILKDWNRSKVRIKVMYLD